MVIDYRALNRLTRKDAYPLPLIDWIFDVMAGSEFFTSLDCKNGFWVVPMTKEEASRAAFTNGCGLYEPVRMTQGLANAPAIF